MMRQRSHAVMSRLPDGWSAPETIEDVVVADEVAIHRAGVSSIAESGEELCGSAADCSGPSLGRAWFELLERVSGYEALQKRRAGYDLLDERGAQLTTALRTEVFPESDRPATWRYARSNGVALHTDWTTACRRALWELAERDRVLRSWLGEIRPEPVPVDLARTSLSAAQSFDWRVCSFPEKDASAFSANVEVVGVFGLPRVDNAPFVLGLAGRPTEDAAVEAAIREALQLMAFLWGEAPPESPPTEPGPMQHLDTYQVRAAHDSIRRWLAGGHVAYARRRKPCSGGVGYVDLTPDWLPAGLRVAKAVCAEAVPLVFGAAPLFDALPVELRVHPIP